MTLNDRFAFEALRRRLDDPNNKSSLVIIENSDGTLDTAYTGSEGTAGMFALAFSLASQCSNELLDDFTPEQKSEAEQEAQRLLRLQRFRKLNGRS